MPRERRCLTVSLSVMSEPWTVRPMPRRTSAKVVSNSAERADNYLVIDKGEDDGVKPEMGVVGGGGVVGIVYLTGKHHSLVRMSRSLRRFFTSALLARRASSCFFISF